MVFRGGVFRPGGTAGGFLLVRIIGGEIRTDDFPSVSEILRFENHVTPHVDRVFIMGGLDNRGIPIEPVRQGGNRIPVRPAGLRADILLFARFHIGPHDIAALGFTDKQIRVILMGYHMKSISETDHSPIRFQHPRRLPGAAGPHPSPVIL